MEPGTPYLEYFREPDITLEGSVFIWAGNNTFCKFDTRRIDGYFVHYWERPCQVPTDLVILPDSIRRFNDASKVNTTPTDTIPRDSFSQHTLFIKYILYWLKPR